MSDQALRYVPRDPAYRPSRDRADAASRWLEHTIGGRAVAQWLPGIGFVDAGSNWEGVRCSACGADAQPWWSDAMSETASAGFASLKVQAACCGASVALDTLHYGWPVAFGSFVLEVMNPDGTGLSGPELLALGDKLGCSVAEIKAHI